MAQKQQKEKKQKKKRQPWDAYRRIAVWLALLLPVSVLVYPLFLGAPMFSGSGAAASPLTELAFLAFPALLSGAVSGSRFFDLYRGIAAEDAPTDQLSPEQAEQGADADVSPIGDWLWGSLVAAIAGGVVIAATVAPTQEHDLVGQIGFSIFAFPFIAFTVALAWALGALCGFLIGMLLGSVLGILFTVLSGKAKHGGLTWLVVAAFLLLLLVSIAGALGVSGTPTAGQAWLFVAGLSIPSAEFGAGAALLWVCRVALWLTVVLFFALIAIGVPHLLQRLGIRRPATVRPG